MKAEYTVHCPGHRPDVAQAAHHFLSYLSPMRAEAVHLTPGHPHHALTAYADDTPENDSHVKQLATYVAQTTQVPSVHAVKRGKGINTWTMSNPDFANSQLGL